MYKEKLKELIMGKIYKIPHGHNPKDFYPIHSQQENLSGEVAIRRGQDLPDEYGKKVGQELTQGVAHSTPTPVDTFNQEKLCGGKANCQLGNDESSIPETDPPTNPSLDEVSRIDGGRFIFLANKGLRNLEDRGGIQYLIEAYLSEFTESENVELILKINPAYGVPNLLKMFPNIKVNGTPKITFIPDNYSTSQLNDLYNSCDVFVSPTRAEAFNLPVLESLACGKPVIATNYGGQTDFIDKKNGWLINYELGKVTHEIEYEGVSWAKIDQGDLQHALRFTFENPEICKTMSKQCIKVAKSLTWANTAKQIHSLL